MKTLTYKLSFLILLSGLFFGCVKEGPQGPQGPAGLDAQVYYSDWFHPTWTWDSNNNEWFFDENAPDITSNDVETGVILAYASLANDVYSKAVRPLPCFALGVDWDFLIPDFGSIQITCDAVHANMPSSSHYFRYIVIPGNIPALKSAKVYGKTAAELKAMPYKDVCKLLNIPE